MSNCSPFIISLKALAFTSALLKLLSEIEKTKCVLASNYFIKICTAQVKLSW